MYPRTRHLHRRLVAVALAAVLVTACGSDDGDATGTTTEAPATTTAAPPAAEPATGELDEFCQVAAELNDTEELPTAEQLAEYAALAPAEIADAAATVVDGFERAAGDPSLIFGDAATVEAIEVLTAFEAEACGFEPPADPASSEIDPNATRIDVTATDYHFDVELPTEAGRYSFVMTNEGTEPHLLILGHLEEGATIEEVMASEGEVGVIETFESGISTPGSEIVVTADLAPGRWVIVCPIPNAEGTSHVELGMIHEFTIG